MNRAASLHLTIDQWIQQHLVAGDLVGLHWIDQSKGIFSIDWPHKSAAHWDLSRRNNNVFAAYARYRGESTADYTVLKQNLRCALKGNRNIEHLPDLSFSRGSAARRAYRLKSRMHLSAPDLRNLPAADAQVVEEPAPDAACPDDASCPESLLSGAEYDQVLSSCNDWLEPLQQAGQDANFLSEIFTKSSPTN